MTNTCIYLRKSREDEKMEKELGKGETLSKHREDLLKYAAARNLTIIKIYEELVSGESLLFRPAMLELLKNVQDGLYDAVLVMDLQRLGRGDMEEQGIILKAFKNSNTKIITPDKEYDLSNEFDEEYSEFEAFMSRKEYKMINKRLQRGILRSIMSGNYNSPFAPFGYLIKEEKLGRTLEIYPTQAEIVQNIYDWYINESIGSQLIAQRLNDLGLTTNKNNNWTCHSVANILKNPLYTGKIAWGKTLNYRTAMKKNANRNRPEEKWVIAEGKHQAIISEEVYNKARAIMQRNIKSPQKTSNSLSNALAGIVVCGICGSKMQYRPYKDSEPHLICKNKCGNKSSKYALIELSILNTLQCYLDDYNIEIGNKPIANTNSRKFVKSNIELLEKQLSEAVSQKEKVYELLEKGVYSIDTFNQRKNIIDEKIGKIDLLIKEAEVFCHTSDKPDLQESYLTPYISKIIPELKRIKSIEYKNLILKSILEKVEYIKDRKSRNGNFEIHIFPLL